jgi:lipopolysaccharide export system permease protein
MHARYLWQLFAPEPRDASSPQKRAEIRAEIFDRLMAPLYPLVFAVIAFAYLGAPRTTRESRTSAMAGAVGGILLVRLVGFTSTIVGVNYPAFLSVQFIVAGIATIGGLYAIRRGVGIEPPAFVKGWLNALSARISRHTAAG